MERLQGVVSQAKADAKAGTDELRDRLQAAREAGDREAEKAVFRHRDARQADVQGRVDAATARMDAIGLQVKAIKSVGDALGLLN